VNFLYSVWATAFAGTTAESIVCRYEATLDGWLVWYEFLTRFEKKGVFNTHKAEHLRNIALLYVDAPNHSPSKLYKFMSRFEDSITNLVHMDVPWDDNSSKAQFETVVNHDSTLWMLHQCLDMTFTEMIDFFRDTASKGMHRSNQYGRSAQR
jgi:hypothetical protein